MFLYTYTGIMYKKSDRHVSMIPLLGLMGHDPCRTLNQPALNTEMIEYLALIIVD